MRNRLVGCGRWWRRVVAGVAVPAAGIGAFIASSLVPVSSAASGTGPPAPLCSQAAVQKALNTGGTYQLCGSTIGLTSQLTMSSGHVTLEDGSLQGLLPTGPDTGGARVFALHGGSLTLVNVAQKARLEAASPSAGAGDGSNGTDGTAGTPGTGPGAKGTDGKPSPTPGADGQPAVKLMLAKLDPEDAGGHVLRGGCMWVGPGASVYLDGGSLGCQAGYGPEPILSGGSGGNGGNGGAGGNGGFGTSTNGLTGPGGNGGNGGSGTNAGNGGNGGNGYDAEGGAIYNQGSLYIVGTTVGGAALGGQGGNGGSGGSGGNGGNGGAGGAGYPSEEKAGGNGGNGGDVGNGGNGGDGGNSGNARGGGIYNAGDMTLAQAAFSENSAETWPGGNMDIGPGCPQQGGCGGQHGSVQPGPGGPGQPPGTDGSYPSRVPQDGAGGNGGNAGNAIGGGVYSTTSFVDSASTFTNNQVVCEACGSAADYPTGNLDNGSPGGSLGSFGQAKDPDVHGPEVCPAGDAAPAARSPSVSDSSTSGTCKLFTAHVYDASSAYEPLLEYSDHKYMIRLQFKSTEDKPIPKLTVTIPGVEPDFGWWLASKGDYFCDTTNGALTCESPSGGVAQGYILAYVLSKPFRKQATVSALGSSVSNQIDGYFPDEQKGEDKYFALHNAVLNYRRAFNPLRQVVSVVGGLLGLSYGLDPVASEDAQDFRNRVIESDPPDANTGQVALPTPLKSPSAKASCAKAKPKDKARCERLLNAVRAYTSAQLVLTSIDEATATAMDRFNTAERADDHAHAALQDDALITLALEADQAVARLNAASRELGGAMAAAGYHDLTKKQVARSARQLQTGQLPKFVLKQLARWGISRQAFIGEMKKPPAGFKPTKLDPVKVLRTSLAAPQAGSYDIGGVAWLIEGLHAAGSLTSAQYTKLAGDIKRYANSPSAAGLAVVKRDCAALPGVPGQFMSVASSLL
jgi:hypothetical protein